MVTETVSRFDFERLVRQIIEGDGRVDDLIRNARSKLFNAKRRGSSEIYTCTLSANEVITALEACVDFIRAHHPPDRPPKPRRHW